MTKIHILLVLSIFLLYSCYSREQTEASFIQVESLLEEHPDSALQLLQTLPTLQELSHKESARYALLLARATDKCEKSLLPCDSLLNLALRYYDDDEKERAVALLYKGRLEIEINSPKEAITHLQEALTILKDYPKEIHDVLLHGTNGKEVKVYYKGQRGEGVYDVAFEGLIKNVERRYRETGSETMKAEYEEFMNITPCHACKGQRLKPGALAVTVGDKNIAELTGMSIEKLQAFLKELKLTNHQMLIGGQILKEINSRIQFLMDVGLNYLTLGRATGTLSGGEAQRIKLATELSKRSTGKTIYILDEPTTGLHFADVHKLTEILHRLTADGNTVIVIEHNLDVIKTADYIIDIGPEGGDKGGTVIASGTPEEVAESPVSYTGKYIKPMLGR